MEAVWCAKVVGATLSTTACNLCPCDCRQVCPPLRWLPVGAVRPEVQRTNHAAQVGGWVLCGWVLCVWVGGCVRRVGVWRGGGVRDGRCESGTA